MVQALGFRASGIWGVRLRFSLQALGFSRVLGVIVFTSGLLLDFFLILCVFEGWKGSSMLP